MKKTLISLLLLAHLAICNANIIADADSAYMADDFQSAAMLYQEAIDSLGPSAERYYNLGNAYYRSGLSGMAIVSYERALRLDPTNKDIRENLEFVNAGTIDRLNPNSSLFGSFANNLAAKFHPNTWAWIAIFTFIIALGGGLQWFFANNIVLRKIGFFGGGIFLILCIAANIMAYRAASNIEANNEAVITSSSVILSTTPRTPKDRSEEAMLLHEGAKITILDSLTTGGQTWYDVEIGANHRAWISAESVEII